METSENENNEAALTPIKREPPIRRYQSEVPVPLGPDDYLRYGENLAQACGKRDLLEKKKKEITAKYANDIKAVQNDIDRLSTAMRDGQELRVTDVYDIYNNGTIETRRQSDDHVVAVRAATPDDRQYMLPHTVEKPPQNGANGHATAAPEGGGDAGGDDAGAGEGTEGVGSEGEHDLDKGPEGGMVDCSVGAKVFTMSAGEGAEAGEDREPERDDGDRDDDGDVPDDNDDPDSEGTESPVVTPPGPATQKKPAAKKAPKRKR